MKRFICVPDSFKGTLSSKQVCLIMEKSIHKQYPKAQVISIEVADGGEGTVDAFLSAAGGQKIEIQVQGPYGEPTNSFYGSLPNHVAVIEMAAAAGLPMVEDKKNPELTTTVGVGQLIADAIDRGHTKIIVGLGGSSTNDGGCGAAVALGVRFLNSLNEPFIPTGGTLKDIVSIDTNQAKERLKNIEIITMCDIDNPMAGPSGAAYVFSPQKGADELMVKRLDDGLTHLSNLIQRDCGIDVSMIPGGGAAGGMGAGMVAFFNSTLQMGIETVLDLVHFDLLLNQTSCVFTGEGRIDYQSLRGKVPIGVARRAKQKGVPVIAVVGSMGDHIDEAYEMGISAIFSINTQPLDFSIAKLKSPENLAITMDNILRTLKL